MRIVLVGGGTGGHFYPLIAVAEALRAPEATDGGAPVDLYYIGPETYDREALDTHHITFLWCPAGKKRRYFSWRNFIDPFKAFAGLFVAFYKLLVVYPDAVFSKGGYTSVPVVFAAWLLRIPIIAHESDSVAGRANRLGGKLATYVAISYPEATKFFKEEKVALTGIPIRRALLAPAPPDPVSTLGLDPALPTLLVLGGSSGAERLNNLILESLDELLPRYNVVHQTGRAHFETVRKTASALIHERDLIARYHLADIMPAKTLHAAYHASSIVISRAGSTTIFETAAHGRPAILVPIPRAISHDQRTNAYAYARSGAAIVMEEGNLRDGLLVAEISRIMGDASVYRSMAEAAKDFVPQDAARKIADILTNIGRSHEC